MVCALYFGSFNPIHSGHLAITRYLAKSSEIDQVRLILSPHNPLKDEKELSDPLQRMNQLKLSISKEFKGEDSILSKIVISDIEFHLPKPLFTIETLRYLSKNEPENRFILVIGGDNILIIEQWHQWQNILKDFEVWVYPRPGYNANEVCAKYSSRVNTMKLRLLSDVPQYDISSTLLRDQL